MGNPKINQLLARIWATGFACCLLFISVSSHWHTHKPSSAEEAQRDVMQLARDG